MNLEDQLRVLIDLAPPHIQRHFACDCAERVLRRLEIRDNRLWNAIKVSRLFAEGEATVNELSAAQVAACAAASGAAWVAAQVAACAAASGAAWVAAQVAAQVAARVAAWDAAWDAARVAAFNAAWVEERTWQIVHLQSLLATHNTTRSSLLLVLQQRAESIKPILAQYAHDLEERAFE